MRAAARLPKDARGLWWSWTVSCGAGEMIGISIAAGLAALMSQIIGDPQSLSQRMTVLCVMIFAGVLEGAAIGYFQWRVLRSVFRTLSASAWLTPTIAVAAIGWLVGMLQPIFFARNEEESVPSAEPSVLFVLSMAAAFGIAAGGVFGFAQWFPLRRHADQAWIWIPANAFGWGVAMVIIFVGATMPDESWSIWQIVPVGMITGVVAGLAIGGVTGIGLLRIHPIKTVALQT